MTETIDAFQVNTDNVNATGVITLAMTNITGKYKYNFWEITTFEMNANMHVCAVMLFCTYTYRGSHWY